MYSGVEILGVESKHEKDINAGGYMRGTEGGEGVTDGCERARGLPTELPTANPLLAASSGLRVSTIADHPKPWRARQRVDWQAS